VCSRTRRVHTTGTPAVSFVMYRRRTAVVRGVYFDERGRKVRRRLRAALFFPPPFLDAYSREFRASERASRIRARHCRERRLRGRGGWRGRESSPGKKLREERERKGTRKGRGGKAAQILQAHHRRVIYLSGNRRALGRSCCRARRSMWSRSRLS